MCVCVVCMLHFGCSIVHTHTHTLTIVGIVKSNISLHRDVEMCIERVQDTIITKITTTIVNFANSIKIATPARRVQCKMAIQQQQQQQTKTNGTHRRLKWVKHIEYVLFQVQIYGFVFGSAANMQYLSILIVTYETDWSFCCCCCCQCVNSFGC